MCGEFVFCLLGYIEDRDGKYVQWLFFFPLLLPLNISKIPLSCIYETFPQRNAYSHEMKYKCRSVV